MSTTAWYKDWFNSDYYHILYHSRDEKEAEYFLSNLLNHLHLEPESKVLDVACGKGRHTLFLANQGFEATGIDLSENSIEKAKAMAKEKCRFLVQDMRESKHLEEFDAVFNLFTSFGYFDDPADDQKAISAFAGAIKKGGYLVIDFLNPDHVKRNLIPEEEKTINGIHFLIKRSIQDKKVVKEVFFEVDGEPLHYTEKVSLLEKDDFQKLINATGLQIINTFGDYSLNPYHKEDSPRMIHLAKK